MAELDDGERAELERLRREVGARRGVAWGRFGRWTASVALLVIAAVLAGTAAVASYVRDEVLDTTTFVETIAPLASDPEVRDAVAHRLTQELVERTDLTGLANQLADTLEAKGAPDALSGLVGPLVSGVSSFLTSRISELMATERFETAWRDISRVAHEGLVTVLTGRKGEVLSSEGDTVYLDLGQLLKLVKERLVAEGLTIFAKVPDVSISYPLLKSDSLPRVRTYVKVLDAAGTWLPWVALALLLAGVLVAPDRRRGIIVASVAVGVVAAALLGAIALARSYYLDNLPPEVASAQAAADTLDTVIRFLVATLQTLLVAMAIFWAAAVLAGPSRFAAFLRRHANAAISTLARQVSRSATGITGVGRVLRPARRGIDAGIVVLALAGLLLAHRPGVTALLWTTVAVLVALLLVELLARLDPVAVNAGGPGDQPGGDKAVSA